MHLYVVNVLFQDVRDDVRQVFRRYGLFLVAQFDDPFGHFAHRFLVEVDAQRIEIFFDIRLARHLSERVFAHPSEPFGQQVVVVQVVLIVPVGMDAGALREYVFADDRFVGRDVDARVGFHYPADVVDALLDDRITHFQVVVQHGDYARQRRIPGPFAQSVDGRMDALHSGFYGCGDVGDRQIVVVVRVEVEMQLRIAFHHVAAKSVAVVRVQHPERVGNHKAPDRLSFQRIDHLVNVVGRKTHPVRPVFQIDVDRDAHFGRLRDGRFDIGEVLLRGFA